MTVKVEVADSAAFGALVQQLVDDRVASRIFAGDPTLWGPDARAQASVRLSWPDLAASSRPLIGRIGVLRATMASLGARRVVLAGMGGSALAPEVICRAGGAPLVMLDTTDAAAVRAALDPDKLPETVAVIASKSGATVETDCHRRALEEAFAQERIDARQRIVVVTDPGSPLADLAADAGYQMVLADPHVVGRYGALSAFGLVPAGLAGADIGLLLDQAEMAADTFASDIAENPALHLGAMLALAHQAGRDKVVLADHGSSAPRFADWAEQLIAESTGKLGRGLLPVVAEDIEAPGFADAGDDAVQVAIGAPFAARTPYSAAIEKPLGGQFLLWEYAVAIAGRVIGIDPFDQPDVEEAKERTRRLLDGPAEQAAQPVAFEHEDIEVSALNLDLDRVGTATEAIDALIAAAPAGGYLAIQAYLNPHGQTSADDLRPVLARRSGLQTTFGWGPRYLHSTGQYHKGGRPNGVFLQITGATPLDLPIPGRAFTFASLQSAQAAGDAAVLAARDRPVLRLHLRDRAAGIGRLLAHL